MNKVLNKDKQGKVLDELSMYMPKADELAAIHMVSSDFSLTHELMSMGRVEFSGRSLKQEVDESEKAFNSYVPPKSDDPDDSWRAQTVRPITRNKLISIAAHVTAAILYPSVFAQNAWDDEDKDAADVMRDLIEWNIDNSNYEKSFINAAVSMLVYPAAIVEAGYAKVMREIKEKNEKGGYTKKQILDDILSGFQLHLCKPTEILQPNWYEPDIQKQRFVIRNKYVDYKEAEQLYGKHENWKHVQPGFQNIIDVDSGLFYKVKDEEASTYMVNEVHYYHRTSDLHLVLVNGVLVTEPDACIERADKKYPFAKSGYEPLNNGQFFYYKSAASKLGSDQQLIDTLYNMVIDGSFLSIMPPLVNYGEEEFGSSVMIPGMVTNSSDPNGKLEPIAPRVDLRAGLESIGLVERSMSESSLDAFRSGHSMGGERTAREIVALEKNAEIALGLFGKMVRFLVEDIGYLLVSDIVQYQTIAEVDQITNSVKYKTFVLSDKVVDNKKLTKKIRFIDPAQNLSQEINPESRLDESFDIMDEEGGYESKTRIYKVNPEEFRKTKFKIRMAADEYFAPKSKALEKALNLELYDRAIQNPTIDQEQATRDFLLGSYAKGDPDKYIKKQPTQPLQTGPDGGTNPLTNGGIEQKGVNTSMLSQLTGSNSLKDSMTGTM